MTAPIETTSPHPIIDKQMLVSRAYQG